MQQKKPNRPNRNTFIRSGLLWLIMFFALMALVRSLTSDSTSGTTEELTQSEFIQTLSDGEVESFSVQSNAGAYQIRGAYEASEGENSESSSSTSDGIPIFQDLQTSSASEFVVNVLPNDDTIAQITEAAASTDTQMTALEEDQSGMWLSLLFTAVPIIFFVIIMYMMFTQSQGGGRNNPMSMGKSKAVDQSKKEVKVRFSDVAGADEEKQELVEVVDFLKDPRKFQALGARIPKGVLLEGPPGTGKTLLAKAVAGEASVPFYSISGSEFVEMFVGVGASRVRDLFENAKKSAPSIIFIDEIDAVGRRRGAGPGSGHDEREQTLNQLLVEMDGFSEKDNVIVIAATNRSDVLDPALLRPGRFDRQVLVGRPDIKGREAILKVHSRNKPFGPGVDLKVLAQQTPGFTGAELENLLNEAALVAARVDKKQIDMVDIDEAQDRVIAGPAKKDRVISKTERRMVAYHEAGHTIAGLVLSDARVVHKVTIVPRGKAGGYAIMLPREDQNLYTTKDLREQVIGLLGGRAAEQVVFNTQTSGASNDFEQATGIVRAMITEYGMNEVLGPISYEGNHSMRGASSGYAEGKTYSERTAGQIDDEVRKFMDACLDEAENILAEHRDKLDIIAEKLLELETLDERTIRSLFETGEMPASLDGEEQREAEAKSFEEVKKDIQRDAKHRQVRNGEMTEDEESSIDTDDEDDDDSSNEGGRNAHIQQDRDE